MPARKLLISARSSAAWSPTAPAELTTSTAAVPVWPAPWLRSAILPDSEVVPIAACCVPRVISCAAAACSWTVAATDRAISFISNRQTDRLNRIDRLYGHILNRRNLTGNLLGRFGSLSGKGLHF